MPNVFKVFISSTWQDLQAERQAVEGAILRMRDTDIAGMEYFGSRSETPRNVSLQELDACNIYVGIFAQRYGSGITEEEYRRAVARNVPVLIYIKNNSGGAPPAQVENDPDKASRLDALLREIKSMHVVSFFRAPDQLATQVVADLHSQLSRMQIDIPELVGQVVAILIPLLPYLTNRERDVQEDAGKQAGGASWERSKALWTILRPKLDAKSAAQAAVQAIARDPREKDAQAAFRQELGNIMSEDHSLASLVAEWVQENKLNRDFTIASGERSVAISGKVTGCTIIAGDGNVVHNSKPPSQD